MKTKNYVGITEEPQRIISLCTGMRGLERGIERSGVHVRVAAFVEIEAFIIENLVQQMEQGVLAEAPIWSNLKTFPSEQFHGRVHGITGGYPCQPFSVAGKRDGTEDPRHLWPYIFGIVNAVRPLWCFFENVPGHITCGYREVRSQLQSLGYKIEQGIFSAEEAGAPHQRKRLFILAVENSFCSGIGNFSGQIGGKSRIEDVRQGDGTKCSIRIESTSELANTQHNGHLTTEERESLEARDGGCKTGEENGKQLEGCGELANTHSSRSGEDTQCCQLRTEGTEQSPCHCGRANEREDDEESITRWPARPGEQQYDWEEARVKSSVGFTTHGYNFREDLLRMAGNGVVEQVAELAWKTLWNKI